MNRAKAIDHPALNASVAPRQSNRRAEIRMARSFDDLLMVYSVRSAVYIAEQECPFAEEFDGNDHCATHFVGFIKGEPAGCIRARFFHDFVKLERLAVLKKFRKSTLAFELVRSGIELARRKGFRQIYGHSREGLEPFWARFGAKPIGADRHVTFSGFRYTEMVIDLEPLPDAITLDSGGVVLLRPEGDWGQPGILEGSATRPVRDPEENVVRFTHVIT
ncbi:MAG: GNAT family N-acetyltransferase [Methylocella sp.]